MNYGTHSIYNVYNSAKHKTYMVKKNIVNHGYMFTRCPYMEIRIQDFATVSFFVSCTSIPFMAPPFSFVCEQIKLNVKDCFTLQTEQAFTKFSLLTEVVFE